MAEKYIKELTVKINSLYDEYIHNFENLPPFRSAVDNLLFESRITAMWDNLVRTTINSTIENVRDNKIAELYKKIPRDVKIRCGKRNFEQKIKYSHITKYIDNRYIPNRIGKYIIDTNLSSVYTKQELRDLYYRSLRKDKRLIDSLAENILNRMSALFLSNNLRKGLFLSEFNNFTRISDLLLIILRSSVTYEDKQYAINMIKMRYKSSVNKDIFYILQCHHLNVNIGLDEYKLLIDETNINGDMSYEDFYYDSERFNPLQWSHSPEVHEFLINKGAFTHDDKNGPMLIGYESNELIQAIFASLSSNNNRKSWLTVVKLLVSKNYPLSKTRCLVHILRNRPLYDEQREILAYLLEKGLDPNSKTDDECRRCKYEQNPINLIELAIQNKDIDTIILLSQYCKVDLTGFEDTLFYKFMYNMECNQTIRDKILMYSSWKRSVSELILNDEILNILPNEVKMMIIDHVLRD